MTLSKLKNSVCLITSLAFFCCMPASANSDVIVPAQDRRGCGDYSILSDSRDRAIFDRHCGINNEKDYKILMDAVDRLDPKREGRAAATRGDFRLAAVTNGGPPRPDQKRSWHIPGLDCKNVDPEHIFIWLRNSDSLLPGSQFGFIIGMNNFAKNFNKTLIKETSALSSLACTPKP